MHRLACLALAACALSAPALAQSPPTSSTPTPEEIAKRDSFTLAGGVALSPDYVGSNDYRLIPAAAVRGKLSGISFSTKGLYLYVDAIPHGADKMDFNLGPIVGARLNRTRHIKDDIVDLLPRRKTAIEVGGFAGVSFHGVTNPYDTLALHLDVLHDVANAHKSTTFSPNVDFSTPLSRTTYASASVGAEFVSNRFADYYFSISPLDSLATGGVLPVFDADGGMKNWKASLLVNQSLSGDLLHGFSLFGTVNYSRLVGDFKRSPIVSQRGSPNQWLLAGGLAYTW
jgi:outer membrane scaffolding protein for murein synthesis (MipA/OmpV family)